MTFPECKDCYTLDGVPCDHRIKYMIAEGFIREQDFNGIKIAIVDVSAEPDKEEYYEPPEKYWKAGKCDMHGGPHIRMWADAYKLFGWDVLTSVLIHEFGHLKLYIAENLSKGIEAERKANKYGFCFMRNDLVPEHYWLHRELFLPSHIAPGGWMEEKFRDEYARWINWMKDAPTVRVANEISAGTQRPSDH